MIRTARQPGQAHIGDSGQDGERRGYRSHHRIPVAHHAAAVMAVQTVVVVAQVTVVCQHFAGCALDHIR